ncbi:MAG: type I DNA topoisomerase [Flavobacteriaceae bacterium]|nr:type I DNA topoisomerase [Flavobacteriaceae bacterium]
MAKNLVIVESPAKAKTIEKFLGKDFKVASSFGHIADLPSKELGVNVDGDFSPKYIVSSDKKKVVTELKSLANKAEMVWLASDEDREGEAIAWHLAQTLKLKDEKTKRIVFHEITKNAILKAIDQPREIDYNLVNAQQARRVLDRLVGYELSPVLWRKVKGGLSAGRVQSVSVRLIVEREREIKAFTAQTMYKTQAEFLSSSGKTIKAQLSSTLENPDEVQDFLLENVNAKFSIVSKETKPAKKSPTAPFTTSTLQQEASRKLYFSVSKTMTMAQRLYEAGLITYMRTDSVNLSKEAQSAVLSTIENNYGSEYTQARNFTTKSKGAQEAHEAIRPTDVTRTKIEADYDQMRLYELIWKRTVASQMSDAKLERTQLKIEASTHKEIFKARGEVIKFEGFLKVYLEGVDEDEEEAQGILPSVNQGDVVELKILVSTQRFSRPPYRYSEAALVKKLEELGIGRPSTYAPTISTVQNRGYVAKGVVEGKERNYHQLSLKKDEVEVKILTEMVGSDKGKLVPTDIGMIVNDFLVANFKNILDYSFTAQVEKDFDEIAEGNEDWTKMIKGFYGNFHETVNYVQENAERESGERSLGTDPNSGRELKVRLGKFGPIAQIGNSDDEDKPVFASLTTDQQLDTITFEEALELFQLPKTIGDHEGQELIVNNGRFGPYIKFADMFVSLPKGSNPMEIDLETAIELVEEKKKADAPIYTYKNLPVTKGSGRFGPFIKWSGMFINVNKKYDFDALSNSDIETLIEDKIQKEIDKVIHDWKDEGIRVEKARWGRSNIIQGKIKIELSKDIDPTKITLEEAKKRIEAKKPNKKKIKPKAKATKNKK